MKAKFIKEAKITDILKPKTKEELNLLAIQLYGVTYDKVFYKYKTIIKNKLLNVLKEFLNIYTFPEYKQKMSKLNNKEPNIDLVDENRGITLILADDFNFVKKYNYRLLDDTYYEIKILSSNLYKDLISYKVSSDIIIELSEGISELIYDLTYYVDDAIKIKKQINKDENY